MRNQHSRVESLVRIPTLSPSSYLMSAGYFTYWCPSFFICIRRHTNIMCFMELLSGLNRMLRVKCKYSDCHALNNSSSNNSNTYMFTDLKIQGQFRDGGIGRAWPHLFPHNTPNLHLHIEQIRSEKEQRPERRPSAQWEIRGLHKKAEGMETRHQREPSPSMALR